jgi:predicted alpha/beta hydrolase
LGTVSRTPRRKKARREFSLKNQFRKLPSEHPKSIFLRKPLLFFSWDEMGTYDIPASIGKILEVSGQQKLFYIGHSMGTTGFMVTRFLRSQVTSRVARWYVLKPKVQVWVNF